MRSAEEWSAELPIGTPVLVYPVIGQPAKYKSRVRSAAWQTGANGHVLIKVEGIAGGYSVDALLKIGEDEWAACKLEDKTAAKPPAPKPKDELIVEIDPMVVGLSGSNVPHRDPDDDLIESVREFGVIQPGMVRPREAQVLDTWTNVPRTMRYELVIGERRWKACVRARVPFRTVVRDLSDREAFDLQAQENLQRSDLSPLQEAAVFGGYVKFGLDTTAIAARVHKSERYVVQRLKLLELPDAAQKALSEGRLLLATAIELACLTEADRLPALALVERTEGEPMPARTARSTIIERFHLRMVHARFDTSDATLVPLAGACLTCPKRSKNQLALWIDGLEEEDRCLDRACWEGKTQAAWAEKKAEAEANGVKVLDADAVKFPHKAGLVDLDGYCDIIGDKKEQEYTAKIEAAEQAGDSALVERLEQELAEHESRANMLTWRDVLDGMAPSAIALEPKLYGERRNDIVEYVDERAALKHLQDKGVELPEWAQFKLRAPPKEERATEKTEVDERAATAYANEKVVESLCSFAEHTPPRPGPAFWRAMCFLLIENGFDFHHARKRRGWTDEHELSATDAQLRALVFDVLASQKSVRDEALNSAAKLVGIDASKIRSAALKAYKTRQKAHAKKGDANTKHAARDENKSTSATASKKSRARHVEYTSEARASERAASDEVY